MTWNEHVAWADEEFATLNLGHRPRTVCAVSVLSLMGRVLGSRVTDFRKTSAERQQAYGFIEKTPASA